MFASKHVLGLALSLFAGVALTAGAHAATWDGTTQSLTVSSCCGSGPFGTVSGSGFGTGTVTLTVTLTQAGTQFISGGQDAVFAFTVDEAVTIAASSNTLATGWTQVGTGAGATVHMDGTGFFGGGTTHAGNGGSNPLGTILTVTVTDTDGDNLAASDFVTNSNGFLFAADIAQNCSATTGTCAGPTGIVGNGGGVVTPLPGAAALFGSVLFGGLGISTWRKRRSRGPASIIA
jgi:hypothetical protein